MNRRDGAPSRGLLGAIGVFALFFAVVMVVRASLGPPAAMGTIALSAVAFLLWTSR